MLITINLRLFVLRRSCTKKEKRLKKNLTSIQHLGLPAFVPHTIIVSFTF